MIKDNNGFIIVASRRKPFLTSAKFCGESLKDYWPESNVTLFTQDEWITDDLYDVFDNVVGGAPDHQRAKLWALSKTPYNLTVYLDADMEVASPEINTIFDQMTNTADIMITRIREYSGVLVHFPGGKLEDHCGMFMYNNKPHTIEFMKQWWELYKKQKTKEWKWDTKLYPETLRPWDQWTYWWLMNKTDYAIKREYFKEDARWNFVNNYRHSEVDKEVIIHHHTINLKELLENGKN